MVFALLFPSHLKERKRKKKACTFSPHVAGRVAQGASSELGSLPHPRFSSIRVKVSPPLAGGTHASQLAVAKEEMKEKIFKGEGGGRGGKHTLYVLFFPGFPPLVSHSRMCVCCFVSVGGGAGDLFSFWRSAGNKVSHPPHFPPPSHPSRPRGGLLLLGQLIISLES